MVFVTLSKADFGHSDPHLWPLQPTLMFVGVQAEMLRGFEARFFLTRLLEGEGESVEEGF
jgi:hypothetical protein